MPISVNWYIENEIIFVYSSGIITTDEFRDSMLTVRQFIDSSTRPLVHAINDTGDIVQPLTIRENIGILREVGRHDRTGWSIILREKSSFVKLGVAIGTSIFKLRTRSFNTLEDAESFLKEVDGSLSWDRVDRSVVGTGVG